MNTHTPIFTLVPGRTRVSDAVRAANAGGVGLWLTRRGSVIIAPVGRPGWRRLAIRTADTMPCAA